MTDFMMTLGGCSEPHRETIEHIVDGCDCVCHTKPQTPNPQTGNGGTKVSVAREEFQYKGRRVFNPHITVKRMSNTSSQR